MITRRQYDLATDLVYDSYLKKGVLPPPSTVAAKAASRFNGVPSGSPTMGLLHLERKKQFPRAAFNTTMDSINFDFRIAYAEFVDLFKAAINSALLRAVEVDAYTAELGKYRKTVSDLKSIITGTSPYTAVFGDSFDDTNGVNRSMSSAEVDIDAGIATLKRSSLGTNRISLAHLYESFAPNLGLGGVPATSVLRNAPVHGHGFSNAILDNHVPWIQSVVLEGYSHPITGDLDIPIVEAESGPVRVSKVELKPHNASNASIQVLASPDGNTFTQFGEAIPTANKAVVFHSPGMEVKVLRIRIYKSRYDEQDGNNFEYIFGTDYIRIFRVAYAQEGILYSREHALVTGDSINKIKLEVDADTPEGTRIDYQVRVLGSDASQWADITPVGGVGQAPQEINVSASQVFDEDINLYEVDVARIVNGMKFYQIADNPSGVDVNPRTAELYRAVNAWRMRMEKNRIRHNAKDVFINFNFQSPDGKQNLYAYRADNATIISTGQILSDNTRPAASVRVPHKIDYNQASMTTIPTERGDHFDHEPNYAIASVVKSVSGQPIGYTTNQVDVEGDRMRFQSNTLDTYHTRPMLKLNSLATAELTENQVANASFVQSETSGAGLQVFSYADDTNPERLLVMKRTSGVGLELGGDSYVLLGDFPVLQNGAIVYPFGSEFIDQNGGQYLKVLAGRTSTPDFDEDMFENASVFRGLFDDNREIDIYVMYASLAGNPVSLSTGSISDGYLLVPTYAHYLADPTMFTDLVFPMSVYIKDTNGSVDGNFNAMGVTKAPVTRTNSDGTTEVVYVDALLIDNRDNRGGTLPPAEQFYIETWYVSYSDITQFVLNIEDHIIKFQGGLEFSRDDQIVVTYRAQFGDKLRVLEETIRVTSEPGRGVEYEVDKDYRIDPGNGTISMVQNGAINRGNAGRAYISMEYQEEVSDLFALTAWFHSAVEQPVDLNIAKFGGYIAESAPTRTQQLHDITLDRSAGELIVIAGPNGNQDMDKNASVKIERGWYHVTIKMKDMSRARDVLTALDTDGGAIFSPGNYFNIMRGYKDPLKYLHPDVFYDANRLGSHKYFTIDPSYGIIVPFNPGDNALLNNRFYDVYKGEVLAGVFEGNFIANVGDMPSILERFRLVYTYTPTTAGFATDTAIDPSVFSGNNILPATKGRYLLDRVQLKATLKRSPGQTADRTPVLKDYKLLIEA